MGGYDLSWGVKTGQRQTGHHGKVVDTEQEERVGTPQVYLQKVLSVNSWSKIGLKTA